MLPSYFQYLLALGCAVFLNVPNIFMKADIADFFLCQYCKVNKQTDAIFSDTPASLGATPDSVLLQGEDSSVLWDLRTILANVPKKHKGSVRIIELF